MLNKTLKPLNDWYRETFISFPYLYNIHQAAKALINPWIDTNIT